MEHIKRGGVWNMQREMEHVKMCGARKKRWNVEHVARNETCNEGWKMQRFTVLVKIKGLCQEEC